MALNSGSPFILGGRDSRADRSFPSKFNSDYKSNDL